MNLILCGMMGVGKTTVGVEIAKQTGRHWYDTDALITEKYGDIAEIFFNKGEGYFRQLETEIVKKLVREDNLVISVGGGLVLSKENVTLLKQNGVIVFLRARVETLLARLQGDTDRPLLQTEDALQNRIQALLSERMPTYESVADFTVDVDEKTPEKIAQEIVSKI